MHRPARTSLAAAALVLALGGCGVPADPPATKDLAGEWVFDEGASDGFGGDGVLTLEADGTFDATGLPVEVLDGSSGTWNVTTRFDTGVTAVELLAADSRAFFDIDGDRLLSRPRGEETTERYVLTRTE